LNLFLLSTTKREVTVYIVSEEVEFLVLDKSLHVSLLLHPVITLTMFCILKISKICEEFP